MLDPTGHETQGSAKITRRVRLDIFNGTYGPIKWKKRTSRLNARVAGCGKFGF